MPSARGVFIKLCDILLNIPLFPPFLRGTLGTRFNNRTHVYKFNFVDKQAKGLGTPVTDQKRELFYGIIAEIWPVQLSAAVNRVHAVYGYFDSLPLSGCFKFMNVRIFISPVMLNSELISFTVAPEADAY